MAIPNDNDESDLPSVNPELNASDMLPLIDETNDMSFILSSASLFSSFANDVMETRDMSFSLFSCGAKISRP